MFCPACGTILPDNVKFCTACGKSFVNKIAVVTPPSDIPKIENKNKFKPQKKYKNIIIIIFLLFATIGVLGYFVWNSNKEKNKVSEKIKEQAKLDSMAAIAAKAAFEAAASDTAESAAVSVTSVSTNGYSSLKETEIMKKVSYEVEQQAALKSKQKHLADEQSARQKVADDELRQLTEQKSFETSNFSFSFYDNFNDDINGWMNPDEIETKKLASIQNGKFYIEGLFDNFSYRNDLSFPIDISQDFMVETTIKWIRGEEKNGIGLDFASDHQNSSYYSFQIAAVGYYSILQYRNKNWTDILPWKSSQYINKGAASNNLKIYKKDNELWFFVNDKLLNRIPWNGGAGCDFGFRIFDKPVVEYDDFILKGTKR